MTVVSTQPSGRGGMVTTPSNFAFLRVHDEQLVRLGALAERYFVDDPNGSLVKMRQFGEVLAQLVAAHAGLLAARDEQQVDLVRRLEREGVVPREVAALFTELRRHGNEAAHRLRDNHRDALTVLRLGRELGVWLHRTFADPGYRAGPFVPPQAPHDGTAEVLAELDAMRAEAARYRAAHSESAAQLDALRTALESERQERAVWEQLASEAEAEKEALALRLQQTQREGMAAGDIARRELAVRSGRAGNLVELDEAGTRRLIDAQLREAGWEADSVTLTHAAGARPQAGAHRAIAEWPLPGGRADYVLFCGLRPVAVVEAKRYGIDAGDAIRQAMRYARAWVADDEHEATGGPWGEYAIPFVFATNGRPYLRQLHELNGIFFADLRAQHERPRALDAWKTPGGLLELLRRDDHAVDAALLSTPFDEQLGLRPYQRDAIAAVEQAIAAGRREILLAMATGTGKTRTCVALVYRLLRAKRFQRVLFLVDRTNLGIQASNAFNETRVQGAQSFADVFGLDVPAAPGDASGGVVHVATVQAMTHRLFGANGDEPSVDLYDCIVVDECHRGYTLDREMTDTELEFRSFDDYISKYRRVLDHFDAVRIGLTATPALHTKEIFGQPVYYYSFRDAVVDGYLVDFDPPVRIHTELSERGIAWAAGEKVPMLDTGTRQLSLFDLPDELLFDVSEFNRKVLTENFNRAVCSQLAREIDLHDGSKTLIFCVNELHAKMVERIVAEELAAVHGPLPGRAVLKITGQTDEVQQAIRDFQRERDPRVVITVELLTTGVDVPAISNLVFLRRVNSRVLYDQMVGRATRLCPEIGKERFRIFDAVGLYDTLQHVTDMKPVVQQPGIPFAQILRDLSQVKDADAARSLLDELVAKLQRRKRSLSESETARFEDIVGVSPQTMLRELRSRDALEAAAWVGSLTALGPLLDAPRASAGQRIAISDHADRVTQVTHAYGDGKRPEDYLESFSAWVRSHAAELPALQVVLTRPRDLTRKQLRELQRELNNAGFPEGHLDAAWRDLTNQEIAARIVGHIRRAALGDPLLPYERRVDAALERLLASRAWTEPQRGWLKRIATATRTIGVLDRESLDDPALNYRTDWGGTRVLDRIFEGALDDVLAALREGIWTPAA